MPGSLLTRKRPLRMTIWWIRLPLSHLAAALPSRNSFAFPQWGVMMFVYDQFLNSTHGGPSYQVKEGMWFSQKHAANLPPKMVSKNFRVTGIHHHHHIPPHHITFHQIAPCLIIVRGFRFTYVSHRCKTQHLPCSHRKVSKVLDPCCFVFVSGLLLVACLVYIFVVAWFILRFLRMFWLLCSFICFRDFFVEDFGYLVSK